MMIPRKLLPRVKNHRLRQVQSIGWQTNQASRPRSAKMLGWRGCNTLRTALEYVFSLLVSASAIVWRGTGTASTRTAQMMSRTSRQPCFLVKTESRRSPGICSRKGTIIRLTRRADQCHHRRDSSRLISARQRLSGQLGDPDGWGLTHALCQPSLVNLAPG